MTIHKESLMWHMLERATVATCQALRSDHDFTYIVSMIFDNVFDVAILVAIIHNTNLYIFDIDSTTALPSGGHIKQ